MSVEILTGPPTEGEPDWRTSKERSPLMANETKACPKCGADKTLFQDQCSWECGTHQSLIGGSHIRTLEFKLIESAHCKCRQDIAALRTELAEAKREVERLRQALTESGRWEKDIAALIAELEIAIREWVAADHKHYDAGLKVLNHCVGDLKAIRDRIVNPSAKEDLK